MSLDATQRQLKHQRVIFDGLTALARDAGGPEATAALTQLAGRYASANHPGTFVSPVLETLLADVGVRTMPAWEKRCEAAGRDPRRILHVLTKAIGVGGHTRYALRWLEHDDDRVHSLVLTGQSGQVPPQLAAAVHASGGELRVLGQRNRQGPDQGFVARAAELRALAARADAVVVYSHPFDVVPVIALAGQCPRPPVLFVNHSDHCFWIGRGIGDLVACIRGQGATICVERRGIPRDRCTILPIPLDTPVRQRSREAAKEHLGLPPSAVVLLTVAAAYKYEPIDSIDFIDLVMPIVAANPDVILLAIGPRSRRWRDAERRSGGRIRALGPKQTVQSYYEACDVYLDSHPVSSVTSLLEAASLGTPTMTLCHYLGGEAVLCSEDPGLDGLETRAATQEDYRSILGQLVNNRSFRRDVGRSAGERVNAAHSVERWKADVRSVYDQLCVIGPVDPYLGNQAAGPGEPGPVDELLCRIQSHPVLHPGLFADVHRERGTLPLRLQALEWTNLAVDEAGRLLAPGAGLLRRARERRFVEAAARLKP